MAANDRITFLQGDITSQKVDAIVNAANSSLSSSMTELIKHIPGPDKIYSI
jgi:hypothetical protein